MSVTGGDSLIGNLQYSHSDWGTASTFLGCKIRQLNSSQNPNIIVQNQSSMLVQLNGQNSVIANKDLLASDVQNNDEIDFTNLLDNDPSQSMSLKESKKVKHNTLKFGENATLFESFGEVQFGEELGLNSKLQHSVVKQSVKIDSNPINIISSEFINEDDQESQLLNCNDDSLKFAPNNKNSFKKQTTKLKLNPIKIQQNLQIPSINIIKDTPSSKIATRQYLTERDYYYGQPEWNIQNDYDRDLSNQVHTPIFSEIGENKIQNYARKQNMCKSNLWNTGPNNNSIEERYKLLKPSKESLEQYYSILQGYKQSKESNKNIGQNSLTRYSKRPLSTYSCPGSTLSECKTQAGFGSILQNMRNYRNQCSNNNYTNNYDKVVQKKPQPQKQEYNKVIDIHNTYKNIQIHRQNQKQLNMAEYGMPINKKIQEMQAKKISQYNNLKIDIPRLISHPNNIVNPTATLQQLFEIGLTAYQQLNGQLPQGKVMINKYNKYFLLKPINQKRQLIWHYGGDKLFFGECGSNNQHDQGYYDKNGYGLLYDPQKQNYRGMFRNNKKNGQGIINYKNGVIYTGEWKNNKMHGNGILINLQYSRYTGGFQSHIKSGHGQEDFKNGDQYKGEYLNGKFNGKGLYKWINNSSYQGDFQEGLMHGEGIWTSSDGNSLYSGQFYKNQRHGQGYMICRNGSKHKVYYQMGSRVSHKKGTEPYRSRIAMIDPSSRKINDTKIYQVYDQYNQNNAQIIDGIKKKQHSHHKKYYINKSSYKIGVNLKPKYPWDPK